MIGSTNKINVVGGSSISTTEKSRLETHVLRSPIENIASKSTSVLPKHAHAVHDHEINIKAPLRQSSDNHGSITKLSRLRDEQRNIDSQSQSQSSPSKTRSNSSKKSKLKSKRHKKALSKALNEISLGKSIKYKDSNHDNNHSHSNTNNEEEADLFISDSNSNSNSAQDINSEVSFSADNSITYLDQWFHQNSKRKSKPLRKAKSRSHTQPGTSFSIDNMDSTQIQMSNPIDNMVDDIQEHSVSSTQKEPIVSVRSQIIELKSKKPIVSARDSVHIQQRQSQQQSESQTQSLPLPPKKKVGPCPCIIL